MLDIATVTQSSNYYVYTLSRSQCDVPFYVGKGRHGRIFIHEEEARIGCNGPKFDVIREIWAKGEKVEKAIVYATRIEQDAFIYEWFLINVLYGYENLTNIAPGRFTEDLIITDRKKVKRIRKSVGLTAPQLATLAGVSLTVINRMESVDRKPVTRLKVSQVAKALSNYIGNTVTIEGLLIAEDEDETGE